MNRYLVSGEDGSYTIEANFYTTREVNGIKEYAFYTYGITEPVKTAPFTLVTNIETIAKDIGNE